MSTTKTIEITCLACPIGCALTVTGQTTGTPEEANLDIRGNKCPRGLEYGKEEFFSPSRTVTTTVAVSAGPSRRVAVKSVKPVLMAEIPGLLKKLHSLKLTPPIAIGETVLEEPVKIVTTAEASL